MAGVGDKARGWRGQLARRAYLCLVLFSVPLYAQDEPPAIVISPEERQAIIDKFGIMGDTIDKLQREYKTCMLARSA